MIQLGERKVCDLMTRGVIAVENSDRLSDAIRTMDEKRLSVVPVVDCDNAVVGILSTSDLVNIFHEIQSDLKALSEVSKTTRKFLIQLLMDAGNKTCVADVMTSPVKTVTEQTNLVVAAQLLNDKHYHHLPVLSESGDLVGILATSDFVRAFAEHGASMTE